MTTESHPPTRKTIRLSARSYKQRAAYFVTICTHEKRCLLSVVDGQSVQLLGPGKIVRATWIDLTNRFTGLELDEYILMPNHIHGILCFVGAGLARPSPLVKSSSDFSLSHVLRVFKSVSTVEMNRAYCTPGRVLWQRSYFDHIIRDTEDMRNHQRYILENPMRWATKESQS